MLRLQNSGERRKWKRPHVAGDQGGTVKLCRGDALSAEIDRKKKVEEAVAKAPAKAPVKEFGARVRRRVRRWRAANRESQGAAKEHGAWRRSVWLSEGAPGTTIERRTRRCLICAGDRGRRKEVAEHEDLFVAVSRRVGGNKEKT
ncbi:hypothetical protein AXF42_Ash004821 [Apostasia shenzhenica]|uniref:Uncharacterized protein n=1 Tax=Apostasia shenzhenica TaxID=1088818 RepID=A0A2I0B7P2_9ASPA|nr:hypothetical protein AXF42_Ash004821 [Apostasia shenzhenica]